MGSEISGRLAGVVERARAARGVADQGERDRLEITSRPGLNEDQTLRAELVQRVRGLIEAGRYETPEKIDVATERAVGHINLLA